MRRKSISAKETEDVKTCIRSVNSREAEEGWARGREVGTVVGA